jgi:hypothetical protein
MHIVYVSDAKAGTSITSFRFISSHASAKSQYQFEEIQLENLFALLSIFKGLFSHQVSGIAQQPDFIFGEVHTHLRVWLLGKVYPQAKTVILMKPAYLFTVLIMPLFLSMMVLLHRSSNCHQRCFKSN